MDQTPHDLDRLITRYKSKEQLNQSELQFLYKAQIEKGRSYYPSYCKQIFPNMQFAWFQEHTLQELDNVFNNRNNKRRLILRMPDQHGKTMCGGVLSASYLLGKFPHGRGAYITYSDDRAKTPCGEVLDVLISDQYAKLFPEFKLADQLESEIRLAKRRREKLSTLQFTNANSPEGDHKGSLTGMGITSGAVGYSYDWIICDDLFNGYEEASSPTTREKRWNIFVNNILTRVQPETIIILLGTWWHPDDIMGRLDNYIKQAEENHIAIDGWENIIFNAKKDERNYPYDHREVGEWLFPERKMNYYMDMLAFAPLMFQIKCQNIVVDFAKKLFHAEDINWYKTLPSQFSKLILTVDPNNGKHGKKTDDCAVEVWGINKPNGYLIDFLELNMIDVEEQAKRIYELTLKYPEYEFVLIEDSANGNSLNTILSKRYFVKVRMFNPRAKFTNSINEKLTLGKAGKYERAYSVQGYFKNGQIFFPHPSINPKIKKIFNQFMNFTGEDYEGSDDNFKDDFVDACIQLLIEIEKFMRSIILGRLDYNIPIKMPSIAKNVQWKLKSNTQWLKSPKQFRR